MRSSARWVVSLLGVVCVLAPIGLAASRPLPLAARVIQQGEFPPFLSLPGQSTKLFTSAAKYVHGDLSLSSAQMTAKTARLKREGFRAILIRQLGTRQQEPFGGLSWVMQLGSAAFARAELVANVRDAKASAKPPRSTYAVFSVATIPDAHGYHLRDNGGSGDNVVFADGPFVYLVGVGSAGTARTGPTRAQLIAAATRLYKRVHGHPAK